MTTGLISLSIGIILLVVAVISFNRSKRLKKTGLKAEGIIFDFRNDSVGDNNNSYPIFRFLTQTNEWITGEPEFNISSLFQKQGDKVQIIYDPADPNDFMIDSKLNRIIYPIAGVIGGIIFIVGIYYLFTS